MKNTPDTNIENTKPTPGNEIKGTDNAFMGGYIGDNAGDNGDDYAFDTGFNLW